LNTEAKKNSGQQKPAVDGWFTWPPSPEPHLIGSKCKSSGDYFFPPVTVSANPKYVGGDVEAVKLSRKGKLHTYTVNMFPPPPPYIAPDPFVPFGVAVIALEKEKMMVTGMMSAETDLDKIEIGMEMELVLELLHIDEEGDEVIGWKVKPV
jgi:uncharacterized OB-fold protein